MSKTITINQLDTGYLIESEESKHAITSHDAMISKIRELLGITRRTHSKTIKPMVDTITTERPVGLPKFGILSEQTGTWPINMGDYMVPDAVPLPINEQVTYFETFDGRLLIKYRNTSVNTTFDEINQLLNMSNVDNELQHVPQELSSNHRTCIRQFMIAVRGGLKPGDSVELDPDNDFRPLLSRPSTIGLERGTLKDVCD